MLLPKLTLAKKSCTILELFMKFSCSRTVLKLLHPFLQSSRMVPEYEIVKNLWPNCSRIVPENCSRNVLVLIVP